MKIYTATVSPRAAIMLEIVDCHFEIYKDGWVLLISTKPQCIALRKDTYEEYVINLSETSPTALKVIREVLSR